MNEIWRAGLKNWLCIHDSLSLCGLKVKYVVETAHWNFAFINSVMVMCWNELKTELWQCLEKECSGVHCPVNELLLMLRFFYQQMHILFNIWNIKIYIKTLFYSHSYIFTVTPTCFGLFKPSSGSLYWAWPKLLFFVDTISKNTLS